MAYDEGLAHRIRELLEERRDTTEKKMFGGLCFLVNGNMACGIVKSELMVRVGPDAYADALARPHAREMDFTGRALKGMVYVAEDGVAEDDDLESWVARGTGFAASLPAKGAGKAARKKAAKKKKAASRKAGRRSGARTR